MTWLWRRPESRDLRVRGINEPAGFADFYESTYPSVLRYLAHQTGDGQVALDLTAEAYAKAFEKRALFRGTTSEEALGWIWAIVRNELNMYWRKKRVELAAVDSLGLPRPAADDAELARIDDLLAAERGRGLIWEAFDDLPADQQRVIHMHVIEERDHAEIAAQLGVSTDVVRARLSRGLRRLAINSALMDMDG